MDDRWGRSIRDVIDGIAAKVDAIHEDKYREFLAANGIPTDSLDTLRADMEAQGFYVEDRVSQPEGSSGPHIHELRLYRLIATSRPWTVEVALTTTGGESLGVQNW